MSSKPLTTTINSDEINYLVFRYLQESGYVHSAFTFGYESHVNKSRIHGSQIPPGALISLMQRGVNFVEIEESLTETQNGAPASPAMDGVTSLLDVHKLFTSENFKRGGPPPMENVKDAEGAEPMNIEGNAGPSKSPAGGTSASAPTGNPGDGGSGGGQQNTATNVERDMEIPDSDVLRLRGHSSEVYVCTWDPKNNLLASASGDATARIWPIPQDFTGGAPPSMQPVILKHPELDDRVLARASKGNNVTNRPEPDGRVLTHKPKRNNVSSLTWSPSGEVLATGSYDGGLRLWSVRGKLNITFELHKGPLFSVKWNKSGSRILTGSIDSSTAVWDISAYAEKGRLHKQFKFHTAPVFDVDWRDDTTFASCSVDKMIYLCSVDRNDAPLLKMEGHTHEINCLKFDPSGKLLASCSADCTAKIWTTTTSNPSFDLKEHDREVYTLGWAPKPTKNFMLATASFDNSVKLWDAQVGECIRTLEGYKDPVFSLDFSPSAEFLATGSFDRCVNIWSVKDGTLLKKFKGDGGVFDVAWNPEGNKVAACFSSNLVTVFDLRKLVEKNVKM